MAKVLSLLLLTPNTQEFIGTLTLHGERTERPRQNITIR
jgi:hypothetical protein